MPRMNLSHLSSRAAASGRAAISLSHFSHLPVVVAEVISLGATAMSFLPFSVDTIVLPRRAA